MADDEGLAVGEVLDHLTTTLELEPSEHNSADVQSPISSLDYGDDDEFGDVQAVVEDMLLVAANDKHDANGDDDDDDDQPMEDAVDSVDSADNQKENEPTASEANENGVLQNGLGKDDDDDDDDAVIPRNDASQASENGSENDDEENYTIEKVLAKKYDSHGSALYFIKWKGYPYSDNTWEPLTNLALCEEAMMDFEVKSAEKLAERHAPERDQLSGSNGSGGRMLKDNSSSIKRKQTASRRQVAPTPREYEVNDVMGLTVVNGEKYFLISIANSTKKEFMRASLAHRVIPGKVIDFYIKSMKWKSS